MASTKTFGRDSQLTARMLLTMFLIGLLYVVFVGVLIAAGVNVVFIIIVAGGLLFVQYYFSDKMALAAMRVVGVWRWHRRVGKERLDRNRPFAAALSARDGDVSPGRRTSE